MLAALVAAPLGSASLFAAMLRVPPLTIGPEGIAYPVIWQGMVPWRSVKDARIGASLGGAVHVIVTVDSAEDYPFTPTYRRIAQRLKLDNSERPIPTTAFGIAPEALLARIERRR